jgi:hypothetical protein
MADVQDEPPSEGGVGVEAAPTTRRGPRAWAHIVIKALHEAYKGVTLGGGVAGDVEALLALFRGKKPPRCVNPDCKKRIPLHSKVCPFCETKQPAEA